MKPDSENPPPHYQVMTVGQAKREHPKDAIFTVGDYCNNFGIKDKNWCYVMWSQSLPEMERNPSVIAIMSLDKKFPGLFETYEEACRMSWLSYLRWEVLNHTISALEIDRIVGRFQTEGRL